MCMKGPFRNGVCIPVVHASNVFDVNPMCRTLCIKFAFKTFKSTSHRKVVHKQNTNPTSHTLTKICASAGKQLEQGTQFCLIKFDVLKILANENWCARWQQRGC